MAIDQRTEERERSFAPYAPGATVLKIIRHFRHREVPDHLTPTNLMQLSVTENLVPRVIRALQFLGLLDADLATAEDFKRLPSTDDSEYQQLLRGLLQTAYREVFRIVDVENAPRENLVRAFLPYAPASQRERMVILFTELAREAGMRVSGTEEEPRMTAPRLPIKKRESTTRDAKPASSRSYGSAPDVGHIPPSLLVLLADLPSNGRTWSSANRDRWMKALQAMVEYLYPIQETSDDEKEAEA